jgi:uncharacterized NAD(P)/FAD-binding protein YdhS
MRDVVVIVGAGFSGTVLAANLLRRPAGKPLQVVLIERGPQMSRGVAYAERDFGYLLNVPAGRLSADSNDAQQFLNFARARLPQVGPEDFLPRSLYGDYLEDLLQRAESEAGPYVRLQRVRDEVLDLNPVAGAIEVRFAAHPPLRADTVVLAVGNPPASTLPWLEPLRRNAALRENPWDLPKYLHEHQSVLIVGNGLTMADVVLKLSADAAHVPAFHTISRRGLLPQVQTAFHGSAACENLEEILAAAGSTRSLVQASRKLAQDVERAGGDWREAVTFIRRVAPQIWQKLPHPERARFMRHARAQWDTHRHRLPPQVAHRLEELKSVGKLNVNAGRVLHVTEEGTRLRVDWLRRGEHGPRSLTVDLIINATGPDYALSRTREPLLRSLQVKGLITADPLGLGLRTDGSGACLDARGEPAANMYYLGPMLRADHWEATAALELRDHAERLALRLTGG